MECFLRGKINVYHEIDYFGTGKPTGVIRYVAYRRTFMGWVHEGFFKTPKDAAQYLYHTA